MEEKRWNVLLGESEHVENVSWSKIGEVFDTEMSTVEEIQVDLARSEKGSVCQTINNCMIVLQRDPVLKGRIRKNELSVTQISENLGFNSIHYFCRVFKKTTGQSPKEYIKTIRSKLEL